MATKQRVKAPKIAIHNTAGRHLGTYEGHTDVEAIAAHCREGQYPSIEDAEHARFISLERIVCTPAAG